MSDPIFKIPTLTKLEKFCWEHQEESSSSVASQLNRSEASIMAAYSRAERKLKEIGAIHERKEKACTCKR